MIRDYKDKKLSEYLEPGQKVLIRFGHGLGDTIMFIPALEKLTEIHLQSACSSGGQKRCILRRSDRVQNRFAPENLDLQWVVCGSS